MGILDNAKEIADLIKKAGDIELYRKIIELEGEIIDLTRENRDLVENNRELRELLDIKDKLTYRKPFYYQEGDDVPYCPRCWESDRKCVHVIGPDISIEGPVYRCPGCKFWTVHPIESRQHPHSSSSISFG